MSVVSGLLSRPSRLLPRSLPRRTFGEERGLLSRTAAGNLFYPVHPGQYINPVLPSASVLVDTVRHAAIQEYLVSINWKFWLHFTIPGKLLVPHWMKIVPFASNWFVLTFLQSAFGSLTVSGHSIRLLRPRNFFATAVPLTRRLTKLAMKRRNRQLINLVFLITFWGMFELKQLADQHKIRLSTRFRDLIENRGRYFFV